MSAPRRFQDDFLVANPALGLPLGPSIPLAGPATDVVPDIPLRIRLATPKPRVLVRYPWVETVAPGITTIKVYNGSSWVNVNAVKVYNGSSWVDVAHVHVHNGSGWVQIL